MEWTIGILIIVLIGLWVLVSRHRSGSRERLYSRFSRSYRETGDQAIAAASDSIRAEFSSRGISFAKDKWADFSICDDVQKLYFSTPLEDASQYEGQLGPLGKIPDLMKPFAGLVKWRPPTKEEVASLFDRIGEIHNSCCTEPFTYSGDVWTFSNIFSMPMDLTFVSSTKSVMNKDMWVGAELNGGSWSWKDYALDDPVEIEDLVFVQDIDQVRSDGIITGHIDVTDEWVENVRQRDAQQEGRLVLDIVAQFEEAKRARQQQTNLNLLATGAVAVGGYYLGKKLSKAITGVDT